MKSIIAAALVAAMLMCVAEAANAETDRSYSGSSHHASRSAKPKSANSDLIVVKCKTKACFKKHPSGVYAFKPKPKKG